MLAELIIPAKDLAVVKTFDGNSDQLGHYLKNRNWDPNHLPALAILGVPEARGSQAPDQADAADAIRQQLYSLTCFSPEFHLIDLGNIICGNVPNDTYAATRMVADELSELGIRLLILGGSILPSQLICYLASCHVLHSVRHEWCLTNQLPHRSLLETADP